LASYIIFLQALDPAPGNKATARWRLPLSWIFVLLPDNVLECDIA